MAKNSRAGGDLESKSRAELEQMAKGIPGIAQSKMNKEELIQAIRQHDSRQQGR